MPLAWESNAFPSMMDSGQGLINKHVLKNADLLVGIFWTKTGTPTATAISGTVEEIEEHLRAGRDAMLYFCRRPASLADEMQLAAVNELRKHYQGRGMTRDFDDIHSFHISFLKDLTLRFNSDDSLLSQAILIEQNPHQLSPSAIELLLEVSRDTDGRLMRAEFKGGFTFQTNGKSLNADMLARTRAKFDDALQELKINNLIEPVGYKGQMFRLTAKGFLVADQLTEQQTKG